jgi:hypothetical protein
MKYFSLPKTNIDRSEPHVFYAVRFPKEKNQRPEGHNISAQVKPCFSRGRPGFQPEFIFNKYRFRADWATRYYAKRRQF